MASAIPVPQLVELFYSYAHADELLCRELQKHLTALRRSSLISDWYDRKIDPGSEWTAEIQSALERAGIILLLISADFIYSKYITDVELPFAMNRHESGRARVVPILLRPVEWHDLPFAKLQVLPSEARPVTSWLNADEAFLDVAKNLRELIYRQRQSDRRDLSELIVAPLESSQRVFDAAMPSTVVQDEGTEVVTMLRLPDSEGLRAILKLDRRYSAKSKDVESTGVELEFPHDKFQKSMPALLTLQIESPGFDPPKQHKQIRVLPHGDSDVFVSMLTPRRLGRLKVNVEILMGEIVIGSTLLVTEAGMADSAEAISAYGVTSCGVALRRHTSSLAGGGTRKETAVEGQEPPLQSTAPPVAAMAAPAFVPSSTEPARAKAGVSKNWIAVMSSAAALVMISVGLSWQSARSVGSHRPDKHLAQRQIEMQKAILRSRLDQLSDDASTAQSRVDQLRSKRKQEDVKLDPVITSDEEKLRSSMRLAYAAIAATNVPIANKHLEAVQRNIADLNAHLASLQAGGK